DTGGATGDHVVRDGASAAPEAPDPVATLQRQYLSTQWRPTGLGASDRAVVRLVDEISWMKTVVTELDDDPRPSSLRGLSLDMQRASATVLVESATLLETRSAPVAPLTTARAVLTSAMSEAERHFEQHLSMATAPPAAPPIAPTSDSPVARFFASLEFSFRSREVGYAAERIATDAERVVTAERRRFFDRLLGHEPGDTTPLASARARIRSHLQRHSVWLHNSVRGAVGLSLAVLIAEEISVQHGFWVILGTLSVLRSNAFNTGQNALRAIVGTLVGFVVGGLVVELVGTNVTLLWFLFPVVLFIAGFAPTAISYAAGQAGFTLTLVILYNIVEPVGWRVGLVRLEDIAIGTAVSAGVALLFWPRGAAAELGAALNDAYTSSVSFLATAASGAKRTLTHAHSLQPSDDRERASAASRRLDDAFRTYLSERGAKPVPLSDISTLVSGVSTLHFSADAVADLWDHRAKDEHEWRDARQGLNDASASIVAWYDEFASRFEGETTSADLTPQASGDGDVIQAVREQLTRTKDPDLAEAVRILWTADYLAAAQRLEASVIDASRVARTLWTPLNHWALRERRRSPEVVA
ncbi:MAG TPA: FUSC family protein, partial [Acidimicrobiales bacterium]|nr:FUSC family protein [Acidimicrobiales bacterium]